MALLDITGKVKKALKDVYESKFKEIIDLLREIKKIVDVLK